MEISRIALAILLFSPLSESVGARAPMHGLKAEIDALYVRSVSECSRYRQGDENCVKTQFLENYQWFVIHQDMLVGPPGVPGPSLFIGAVDHNPAKHR